MQKTITNKLLFDTAWVQNLEASINHITNNQEETNRILKDICDAVKTGNTGHAVEYGILDVAAIKRRLQRIKIMIGSYVAPNSYDDITKEWESCVKTNLSMTRKELLCSIERRRNKTIFDVMEEIPEFRKIGIDLLLALERKYEIPPAIYSVYQVRQISILRHQFDQVIIRNLNPMEFNHWVNDRCGEADVMFKESGEDGRDKLYWMFAKRHPELIPERQMQYISNQELVNVVNRAINDSNIRFGGANGKYFPLSDRKHETTLFRDSFIDIVLRCLIS